MANFVPGKYRRGTRFKVSFPTLPSLQTQPVEVDLVQKQYHHDVLIMRFTATSSLWAKNIHTGVPVQFNWTQGNTTANWLGYVSFLSSETQVGAKRTMEVHCVGASFPLKQRVTRVFKNKTIPEVAKIIAQEYGFHFVGENNERRFTQLTISGQSYWEWLHEQAKRIGYALVIDGTDFTFRPIDKLIDHSVSSTPILSFSEPDVPSGVLELDRTLDHFKVLNGDYIEGGVRRTTKTVGGVDPITGKVIRAQKKPNTVGRNLRSEVSDVLFDEQNTTQVVHDSTSAIVSAEGSAHMARLSIPAKAKCQGDPRIRPYSPVYISGTGNVTDGYWIATEVKHALFSTGEYLMDLSIASDGSGNNATSPIRKSSVTAIGTVDIEAAIAKKGVKPNNLGRTTSKLDIFSPILVENKQGYRKTPTLWKTTQGKGK